MQRSSIALLFLVLLGCSNCSKKIASAQDLDASLSDIYSKSLFAGFTVSVVKKDKTLFQKAYGQADVAKNTLYTTQTVQPIASISKTFIGVALMKAIEQGLFTLETPINDILPFAVKNPNLPDKIIRVKHLASHTSGIVDVEKTYFKNHTILTGENTTSVEAQRMINELGFGQSGTVLPLKDFLKAYFMEGGSLYDKANFQNTEPASAYKYSNIGASLAAYLIEVKTGKSFADYCVENIFTPLSMSNTSWSISAANRSKLATLYWTKSAPLPYYKSASYPDGELITCNDDLTKFFSEMMKGFAGESTFLKKESYDMMFKKQFDTAKLPTGMSDKEDNSGIFWVYFKNGRLGHTGGDLGVTTVMGFFPDKQIGYLFMCNNEYENLPDNTEFNKSFQGVINTIKEFETNN
jgi:CubicO group peptidase (beta-lactamase class C family)